MSALANLEPYFETKTGLKFLGATSAQLTGLHRSLFEEFGLLPVQAVEAASYSMAMVARYALGLSAQGGEVACIVSDSLPGWIALATMRHLANAGATGQIFVIGPARSDSFLLQKELLAKMSLKFADWQLGTVNEKVEYLSQCHNVIYGISDTPTEITLALNSALNELRTPIHCVMLPTGIDPDTGKTSSGALFASSTLSLGAPLVGLFYGHENAGRHYICDISLTTNLYRQNGCPDLTPLFSEQPVMQILPSLPKDEPAA